MYVSVIDVKNQVTVAVCCYCWTLYSFHSPTSQFYLTAMLFCITMILKYKLKSTVFFLVKVFFFDPIIFCVCFLWIKKMFFYYHGGENYWNFGENCIESVGCLFCNQQILLFHKPGGLFITSLLQFFVFSILILSL